MESDLANVYQGRIGSSVIQRLEFYCGSSVRLNITYRVSSLRIPLKLSRDQK